MDEHKKLAFIAHMTDRALVHAASTPNMISPKGTMSHEKMLSFVSGMTKQGLQHFATGGTALSGPVNATTSTDNSAGGVGGAISGFLGTNNNNQAHGVPIQMGTNTNQLNKAYTGAQGALGTQTGISNTLNTGLNQGAGVQSTLSNMYLQQAQGQGPNPAQAELNQNTGQNIAQTAALIAGGRGANPGLTAEAAARQGAATQQQAVGQAATLQAQQQLAAEQNLQNLSASQVAQGIGATQTLNNAQQNEQNILQGANTAGNNANVSMQSNVNNVNAGIGAGNQSAAGNAVSGILGLGAAAVGLAKGGMVEESSPDVENFREAHPVYESVKGGIDKASEYVKKAYDSVRSGEKDNSSMANASHMAQGGVMGQGTSAPQSYVGQWVNSNPSTQGPGIEPTPNINTDIASPFAFVDSLGLKPKAKPSGGDNNLKGFDVNNELARNPASGASDLSNVGAANSTGMMMSYKGGLMKKGGKVLAHGAKERAMVPGDSLKNDKVPAMLSQGELVIDRDTMKDPGPMGQMARALAHHLSKKNNK